MIFSKGNNAGISYSIDNKLYTKLKRIGNETSQYIKMMNIKK